jgi:ABC-type multidrug transport system ATPase subunit
MGGQLSGGEQQMLTVGRALMGNPDVLLLDEPSEGLAPIMVQKIGDLIATLHKLGKTIVLAEQNLHFCLGLADRAVVIDKGTDVFCGTIHELNDNSVIYRCSAARTVKQRDLSASHPPRPLVRGGIQRLRGLLCIFQKSTPHRPLT